MNNKKLIAIAREFSLSLVILTLIFISFFAILIPKINQIFELKKDIKKQETVISQLSQKVVDLQTLSEADIFESSTLLQDALPAEEDFYKVVMMSKKVFSENNVELSSFKFAPGVVSGDNDKSSKVSQGPQKMAVNVSFFSSFEDLKRMLLDVNTILPLTDIESLKFGEIMEATDSGDLFDLNGKIIFVSYWAPLPETLGKPEKPLAKISTEDNKLIEELKHYSRFQDLLVTEEFSSEAVVGKDNPF